MNKKLIISKTILFIFIITFILGFQTLFGTNNTLIGVTIITAALMLLERDLTLNPIKNLFYLILVNVFLGITSFLATKGIWIAIPINFFSMFFIGYFFSYHLKSNLYIPFGLQYIFMVSIPVNNITELTIRLYSLISGSVFVILMHILCNKNRFHKQSDKITNNIFLQILDKINKLSDKEDIKCIDKEINNNILSLKKLIYNKRKDSFYLTKEGSTILTLCFSFEYINNKLNKLKNEINEDGLLQNKLKELYSEINYIYNNKKNIEILNTLKNKYKNENEDISNNIYILVNSFIELNSLDKKNQITNKQPIPKHYSFKSIVLRNFNIKSLKFSYAFRMSLAVTISLFVMDYFNIYEGRWLALTAFSLVQPYGDYVTDKSKQRMKGTLIGGTIFIILFSIIKTPVLRSTIIILAGYLDGYNTRYDRKMICVTISALGTAALTSNINIELGYRILFVALGVALALVFNKFILPYCTDDANKELIDIGNKTTSELIKEIEIYKNKKNNCHSIENLFMIFSLLENKLNIIKNKEYKKIMKSKRKIINKIYYLYILFKNGKLSYGEFHELTIKYCNE